MEGKNSKQYDKKRKNSKKNPWECEGPTDTLVRRVNNVSKIRRYAGAVERMTADHHPNARRRIAFNLRRLATRVEKEQNSLVGRKRACSMVGVLGGTLGVLGGGILINQSDGIAAVTIAGIGIILFLIGAAFSFWSSVSNSRKKSGLVEEIDAQIKQEREFYSQLYDKLEELDKLLADNENECHNMAEIIMKFGFFGLTASAAIQPYKHLLEAYEDMKKIGNLIPKSMIPTVRHDLSMNDDRRKIAGGVTILAGVAIMGIEFYNFVARYKDCARNGEVEKIREIANLLV